MPRSLFYFALAFSLLLILLQWGQATLLFRRELIEAGELWRLLSGQFVHTNWPHLGMNLAGFWILLSLTGSVVRPTTVALYILCLALGIGLALYFWQPALQWYAGFSGVLYGLLVWGGIQLWLAKDYVLGAALIVITLGKLAFDAWQGGNPVSEQLIGAPVVAAAHYYGVALAFLISLATIYRHYASSKTAS